MREQPLRPDHLGLSHSNLASCSSKCQGRPGPHLACQPKGVLLPPPVLLITQFFSIPSSSSALEKGSLSICSCEGLISYGSALCPAVTKPSRRIMHLCGQGLLLAQPSGECGGGCRDSLTAELGLTRKNNKAGPVALITETREGANTQTLTTMSAAWGHELTSHMELGNNTPPQSPSRGLPTKFKFIFPCDSHILEGSRRGNEKHGFPRITQLVRDRLPTRSRSSPITHSLPHERALSGLM